MASVAAAQGITTTIKTDVCSFSEFRIYPGRGKKFFARDGKVYIYIGRKQASLAHQRIKPARITWTQAWRRLNRKLRVETGRRRRAHKQKQVQRAIVGLSLDEIKNLKTQASKEASHESSVKKIKQTLKKADASKGGNSAQKLQKQQLGKNFAKPVVMQKGSYR